MACHATWYGILFLKFWGVNFVFLFFAVVFVVEKHLKSTTVSRQLQLGCGWLVPIFRLLHLEMNIGRAFVKLNWDIFIKSSGFTLESKSLKASSQYLYEVADHHRLWHLLEITYMFITMELVLPVCQRMPSKGKRPILWWLLAMERRGRKPKLRLRAARRTDLFKCIYDVKGR